MIRQDLAREKIGAYPYPRFDTNIAVIPDIRFNLNTDDRLSFSGYRVLRRFPAINSRFGRI